MSADLQLMPIDLLTRTVADNPYIRQTPSDKQLDFLILENKYALLGGAGGGGKSSALLMAALQFCHDPVFKGYSALIVRRTLQDLKQPGGLMDRALAWLDPFLKKKGRKGNVEWNGADYRLRFPNGSTIQFGYCDNEGDERRYHGAEYQGIFLDEGAQFSEKQLIFFMSERLRKADGVSVPLRFRVATTPGGPGHELLKRLFISPGEKGYVFVPARVEDNPGLSREEYADSLAVLKVHDPLRYRQMLEGDWDAVAGNRFRRDMFGTWQENLVTGELTLRAADGAEVETFDPDYCPRFCTCDPAASTSAKADNFALAVWLITPRANVVWWHLVRDKFEIQDQVSVCQGVYRRFRPQFLAVEEVMNQRALAQMLRRSTAPVMVVKGVSPLGRDKLARAAGAITMAASGRIFLPHPSACPPDFPLSELVAELVSFTGDGKGKDDTVDCASYMTELLPFVRPGHGPGRGAAPFRHVSRVEV